MLNIKIVKLKLWESSLSSVSPFILPENILISFDGTQYVLNEDKTTVKQFNFITAYKELKFINW